MSRIINNYFDGLAITPRHRLIYVVIMFAYFFEQFDNWNFGYVLPSIMQSMGLDMGHAGIITSWYFVGMMTGSIAAFSRTCWGAGTLFSLAYSSFPALPSPAAWPTDSGCSPPRAP